VVYGADELYILAGRRFPSVSQYGDFPQIENGVGMVPLFLHRAKRVKFPRRWSKRRFLAITGVSFFPFLKDFIEKLKVYVKIELLKVHNRFFGETVTVTGLLTGKDILREVSEHRDSWDTLLVPDVALRDGGDLFLDDTRPEDLSEILGMDVWVIESTPEGLISALEEKNGD
jgi:NifB/MoaA-like Fe-S oxidoreductase